VKKSAAAIPKRGTVLLCTGHHARIFPTPIPASTSRRPRDHSSLLRPSQTRRSLTRDALDRASPDAEGPCHFQDADTLRKPFAPSAPGMVTCCAPTVTDQAAAARARALFGRAATDDGNSILDYVAAVADFAVARAAYRAACRRWPEAKITLRQGARVVERNWSTSEAAN